MCCSLLLSVFSSAPTSARATMTRGNSTMIARITASLKEASKWIWLIISAGFMLCVGLLYYGKRKEAAGDEAATLRSDRERLREAEESGDDSRVEDEWRRSRR